MGYFTGQVAAVTGAASGIGRALAQEFAKRGADLALCDVNQEGLDETVAKVEALGKKVSSQIVDVADRQAVYDFAEATVAAHGHVDVIINNAGVTLIDTVEEMNYDDFEWLMDINFWGVVYGTKAFLPHIRTRPKGHIVNISSVFGIIAVPSQSAYNAAKFAVRGFTESLRQELLDTSVSVSCVHPGGIKTNIVRASRFRNSFRGDQVDHQSTTHEFEQKMARTTAEKAAQIIIDGMERKQGRILVGFDAKVIDRLQRWFPVAYQSFAAKQAKKRG